MLALVVLAGLAVPFVSAPAFAQEDGGLTAAPTNPGGGDDLNDAMTEKPEEDPQGGTTEPQGGMTQPQGAPTNPQSGGGEEEEEECGWTDIECYSKKGFAAMLRGVAEWVATGIEKLVDTIASAAFTLPNPDGGIREKYEFAASFVKPFVLVAFLLLGFSTMLRSANLSFHLSVFDGMKKIIYVVAGLAFFPDVVTILSQLTSGLATGIFEEKTMFAALGRLAADAVAAARLALVPGAGTTAVGIWALILLVPIFVLTVLVLVVAIFKNVFFVILIIVGPFAIISYLIPGLSDVAGAWLRGIMACAAIPILYSIELTVGTWIIGAPDLIFPGWASVLPFVSSTVLAILLWMMFKTPFKVLSWAFHSYHPGSGVAGSIAQKVAVGKGSSVAGQMISKAAVAATGGAAAPVAAVAAGSQAVSAFKDASQSAGTSSFSSSNGSDASGNPMSSRTTNTREYQSSDFDRG